MKINHNIDQRLLDRGTKISDILAPNGSVVWKIVGVKFFNIEESGGRHHIYIESLDENGQLIADIPFTVHWSSGEQEVVTTAKSGFDAANFPMSEGRNAFSVTAANADMLMGVGMGYDDAGGWNAGEHTSTLVTYQRMIEQNDSDGGPVPPVIPVRTVVENLILYSDGTYERSNG